MYAAVKASCVVCVLGWMGWGVLKKRGGGERERERERERELS